VPLSFAMGSLDCDTNRGGYVCKWKVFFRTLCMSGYRVVSEDGEVLCDRALGWCNVIVL